MVKMDDKHFDCLSGIREELARHSVVGESDTENGFFKVKTANKTLEDSSKAPDPIPLWKTLWYEGEVCCLFSDSNLGKSILAVQIAEEIAHKQKVLYFDFELSDKQFEIRYSDENKQLHRFPDNLYRVTIDRDKIDPENYDENLMLGIENAALSNNAKVLIVDNLTFVCSNSEKGDAAGFFMTRITDMAKKHALSILILAHTPKRFLSNPITQNDIAGSKKLYNFFDSAFAIGQSALSQSQRYLIQVKVRTGSFTFGKDHVIVCTVEKVGDFLRFVETGFAREREHLRNSFEEEQLEFRQEILRLHNGGSSIRDIASQLNIGKSKVERLLKKV